MDRELIIRGIRDVMKGIEYDEFEILGKEALYSKNGFILPELAIGKVYTYWLRGMDDDPDVPATVEKEPVRINYCGCVLTKEPLELNEYGYMYLTLEDWGFPCSDDGDEEYTFVSDIYTWLFSESKDEEDDNSYEITENDIEVYGEDDSEDEEDEN